MSTVIGNLRVVLGLDAAAFQQGLSKATDGLRAVGRNMTDIGRSMTVGIAAPVTAFGVLSLKAAGDFEAAMNRVQAATGASAAELKGLEGAALKMGETTQFKASEAAAAIEMLAKNGLDASQIMGGALEASMLLAASSGTDLASSSDLATDVMLQFGKQAGELTGLVDGMTGTMLVSKFGFDDYRLAIAQAGGVAGGLGVSFEDMNASIAGTSALFAGGYDAGTAFKTFLQRLVPASDAAGKAMDDLGLEFFEADGSMRSMAEIAQELQDGLAGLSDEARNDALSTIFGTDALRTAIGLAEQGSAGIEKLKTTIGDASATEQAEARLKGFNGEMLQLKSAIEALMIAIGNSGILEWATGLAKQFTALVLRLKETNPEMLRMGLIFAGVAAALGPVIAGIGMMLLGLGPLLTGIKLVVAAVAILGAPFTLAAAAIAAAAVAIYANWDSVGPWFGDLMASLGQFITGFAQLLTGIFTGDMALAVEGLKNLWGGWKSFWETMWAGVVGIITFAWENILRPITDLIGITDEVIRGWERVQTRLKAALDGIVVAFQTSWATIKPIIDSLSSGMNQLNGSRDGPISSGPYTGGASGPVLPGTSVPMDMRSGLQGGTQGLRDQGVTDAQAYGDGFREGMGIQSPSRVMEEAGHYIMQGLGNGIMQQQPQVTAQTESLGQTIQQSITGHLDGIIRGTTSVKEAFASMLQDMASQALSSGVNTLLAGLFGPVRGFDALSGALRGVIPSFAGGGYTWDGPRSGGLDGQGGQLGLLHAGETIIDHRRGAATVGAGGSLSIGFDRSTGGLTAVMHDIAGNVVASARQSIVSESVGMTGRAMRKTKAFGGRA